jgi:DNA-binding MarR family transcriptional regulator
MTPTEGPSPERSDTGHGRRSAAAAEGRAADEAGARGAATGWSDPGGGTSAEAEPEGGRRDDAVRGGTSAEAEPGGGRRDDTVAAVVRQWQAVRPGLDTGPMEIIGRINRCAALLQQAEDAPLRRAGLSRPEFDLLGALRRTGHELTPGELARETFSSGAAVTKRLKQLTERGLVERRGDTRDRRVVHLRLTDAGRDLVDGILPVQLAYETAVLSGLDGPEQGELASLLGELLSQLEGRLGVLRA